ncbi:hypothetical protein Bbelb_038260 [Branchiostoma belcheri]|nr:hypothetical protein Bbelb_038260 [Branchiostoma belcheri]
MASAKPIQVRPSCFLVTIDDLVSAYDRKAQVDMGILDLAVPLIRCHTRDSFVNLHITASEVPSTNGLDHSSKTGTTGRLFADDCFVYREIRGQDDQVILQRDLIASQDWATTWGMKFNPQKCKTMSITRNRNPLTRMYKMCGEFIHQTEQAKYLGLTTSQDLKWSAHINTVAKRANHRLHFLSRNLRFCPRKVRETAYFSLVRSTIEYGSASGTPTGGKTLTLLKWSTDDLLAS